MTEECVFCKIIKGEIPSYKIYENEKIVVILDINPANEGHLLIIPKKHFDNIFDIEEDDWFEVMRVARKISLLFKEYDGLNLLQNNKPQAGQIINHFHLHLIPRVNGDEKRVVMKWLPKKLEQADFEEIKEELKKYVEKIMSK